MIYKLSRRGLGFVPRSRSELLREFTALIFSSFCIKTKGQEKKLAAITPWYSRSRWKAGIRLLVSRCSSQVNCSAEFPHAARVFGISTDRWILSFADCIWS